MIKSILQLLAFVFISQLSFGQTNEIKIKFIGNCGLHMTDGNLNVFVDFPYKSGAFNYMEYDKAQLDSIPENSIFIFTHKHPDHYSHKNMRKTLRKKKGKKYGKWNLKEMQMLSDTTKDFSIQAIETEHQFSLKHYSYLITWHDKRLYFSGDVEVPDTLLTFKNLDWAFVPYWVQAEVKKRNLDIDAKQIALFHFYPIMEVTNSSPEKLVILNKEGERISIPY